ncbi:MAG: FkbM family methyltransferase [Gemmataceae bacterium]
MPHADGFYIDVGAADPVELSVTKFFYDRGWSGINVEPQSHYYAALCADRPRDTNLQLVLSDAPGEVTFYEAPTHPGWAGADPGTVNRLQAEGITVVPRTVQAVTLAEVCEKHVGGRTIDFLKVDVEGHERAVLAGGDFKRFRPRVVVIEATEVGKPDLNYDRWEDVVLAADYRFAAFDGLNRYYVRAEDEALIPALQVPANVHDEFQPYEWLRLLLDAEARLKAATARADAAEAELTPLRAEAADLRRAVGVMEKALSDSVPRGAYEAATRLLDEARAQLGRNTGGGPGSQ